jgi:hypothetical protein
MEPEENFLERIEIVCNQIAEANELYKKSLDEDRIFEVRKKLLLRIRELENELVRLQVLHQTNKKPDF